MAILYCAIPYFAAALARQDDTNLEGCPLVLMGPEGRVFGMSAEAAACGVRTGLTARNAEACCPDAQLLDADIARCRAIFEMLLQVLECSSPTVEPHSWGAAFVDLGELARGQKDIVAYCQQVGRAIRRELGQTLQPALGWDSSKFTAQTAARRTQPGHLLVVDAPRERTFLQPLSVTLLPLPLDTLRRLSFLGLRTLGQYAALPSPAVELQFGRVGWLAQRCARGEDDRPVIPRHQATQRTIEWALDAPLAQREQILAVIGRMIAPTLLELRESLKACGQVRLIVGFDDGGTQERMRTLFFPTADETQVLRILEQLMDEMQWLACALTLTVALEQIQDVVVAQLTLFGDDRKRKLQEVQRYLIARFGASRLRRAILSQPGAPLPEWRVGWLEEREP